MPKEVHFQTDAQNKLLHGATLLTNTVRLTLGPKSKSVLIEKKWGKPLVCNDGVTIAREFQLKDPIENMGAQMMKEVAELTGHTVGDGTSTATILAHSILAEGLKNVAAGASAIDLKKGLEIGVKLAVETIRTLSKKITTRQEKEQVATISAHNDVTLGKLVADAIEKVGSDGIVTVEEARGTETVVEVVQGMQFDRGYLSPYFTTDKVKMEARLDNPYILITDKKIGSIEPLIPVLEQIMKGGKPLLIIADDVEGEALAMLVVNKIRATLSCVAVKSPGFGEPRKEMLEDIAILTGGKVISEEAGMTLENIKLENLGQASQIIIDKDSTTIIGGHGEKNSINDRIEELKKRIDKSKNDYVQEKLTERLGKLKGGVAVVQVGAPSEAEMKNKKEALDDAISATKAALTEGIVPGAGLSLIRAAEALYLEEKKYDGDIKTGMQILRTALEAPTRQIAENSGDDPGMIINEMKKGTGNFGYDAVEHGYVDLVKAGIIDPTKVVRTALENAVSVASVFLLTEATVSEEPHSEIEDKSESAINRMASL